MCIPSHATLHESPGLDIVYLSVSIPLSLLAGYHTDRAAAASLRPVFELAQSIVSWRNCYGW